MIVSCTGCGTKYKVADDKIGPSGIKVRCPKCRTVFEVGSSEQATPENLAQQLFGKDAVAGRSYESAQQRRAAQGPAWAPSRPAATPGAGPGAARDEATQAPEATPKPARAPQTAPKAAEAEPVCPPATDRAAELAPEGKKPAFPFKTAEQDPKTLARALVSDILFYNRDNRDKGLAEGKVLAYLGREIARSWDVYKERVGIEKAVQTEYFREAVNEILGGGKSLL